MTHLAYQERPAAGEAEGLLILHHGRGSDEQDLIGLADVFDPDRRLLVVSPGAPLVLPGAPGKHWYVVPRVGYPDHSTFNVGFDALAGFHDDLWARTGIPPERTILGGFSQGAVMSFALGLSAKRPTPAGVLGLSGFVPTVEGWEADLAARQSVRIFIAHGAQDPVIGVGFGRSAQETLAAAGLPVEYHEGDAGHTIDPSHVPAITAWVAATLPAGAAGDSAEARAEATTPSEEAEPPKPVDLRDLRRGLLDVHRRLLQTQQAEVELLNGAKMSPHEVLGAAISDPRFAWLRQLSELITQIDDSLHSDDPIPDGPIEFGQRARSLVGPPDPVTAFGQRYLEAMQANPDVILAHRDLIAVL